MLVAVARGHHGTVVLMSEVLGFRRAFAFNWLLHGREYGVMLHSLLMK